LDQNDRVPRFAPSLAPRFRPATVADVAAVVALVQASYRGDPSRVGWTTEADLLDGQRTDEREVIDIVRSPDAVLLVAEVTEGDGDVIVGCCHVGRHPGHTAHLGMFAVAPQRQGHGYGRAIVAEAERIARAELGATTMVMFVIRQRDDVIAWYERLGYRRTGRTEPFPYGDERFGLPRRPDLAFTVIAKSLAPADGPPPSP